MPLFGELSGEGVAGTRSHFNSYVMTSAHCPQEAGSATAMNTTIPRAAMTQHRSNSASTSRVLARLSSQCLSEPVLCHDRSL
jgi:hypothetical protein